MLLNQTRIQQNKTHITITYHQQDASRVENVLRSPQTRIAVVEVSTKQC